MVFTVAWVAILVLTVVAAALLVRNNRNSLLLPPGPKPLPLVGNLFDVPRKHEWATFTRWGELYGSVVYVNVLGKPMIILNSMEAATELMNKRSTIYSDRPRFPLIDLIGQKWNLGFMSYGNPWKTRKAFMMSKFTKSAVSAYRHAQENASIMFLKNLLRDPDNFAEHLRLLSTQLIIDVTYGISVTSREHPLIDIAEEVMHSVTIGLRPVFWIFDSTHLLQYIPRALGGNWIWTHVKKWQKRDQELLNLPYQMVKKEIEQGNARPSYVSTLVEELDANNNEEKETLIKETAALAYGAGADTALAAFHIFFVAMLQNPNVQRKAQEEIDRVVGTTRLPDQSNQAALPYVTAVMKESLRWHAATPQGIAHRLTVDDEYKGWRIPAGSMIIPNVWGMLRDPAIYPNPSVFEPERYFRDGKLDFTGKDPAKALFGFGRRVCAGEHFTQEMFFCLIAQFLSVFNIMTVDGGPPPTASWTSGGISFPEPYKCLIRPRSEAAKVLIEKATSYHAREF